MNIEKIEQEAKEISAGIIALKERAMIYQAEDKEKLARKRGLPIDHYYFFSYNDWVKIKEDSNHRFSNLPGVTRK